VRERRAREASERGERERLQREARERGERDTIGNEHLELTLAKQGGCEPGLAKHEAVRDDHPNSLARSLVFGKGLVTCWRRARNLTTQIATRGVGEGVGCVEEERYRLILVH